jgi:chromosome segregation ATPase
MAKTGKTLSRTLRKEFSDDKPLPKSLFFIGNVKYTAIAEVLLEGKARAKTLVEFTPVQLKALMESRIHYHAGALSSLNKRGGYGIYRKPPPVAEAVAAAQEASRQHGLTIKELKENEERLERSLQVRANTIRGLEQLASDFERDLQESRKVYQALQNENRKLKERIDRLLGKEGRPRSSTDKQVESVDPSPYRHRLPGSHG